MQCNYCTANVAVQCAVCKVQWQVQLYVVLALFVCLLCLFVCLLRELHALHELP